MEASTNEKKWLIKSSGMIVGPLSTEEIIADIKTRKITMIDEVRSPSSRWKFIREHQQFANAIEEARKEQENSREDTATTFVGPGFIEKEDETPAPVTFKAPPSSGAGKSSETKESTDAASIASKKVASPVYVANIEPNRKKGQSRESSSSLLSIFLILVVLIAGAGLVYQFYPRSENRSLGYEDFVRLAKTNKNLGNYEKSLEFYRKAESIRKLDVSSQLSMVPLLMVVENQNVQARQILESLMSLPSLEERAKLEAENLMALTYLREGQLQEAKRRYSEIIAKAPQIESAQVNLVEISILESEFIEAKEKIASLMTTGLKEHMLFLYRSLVTYRLEEKPAQLEAVLSDLRRYYSQYQDFHAEVTLLSAAVLKKMHQDLSSIETIQRLLSIDPDLTRNHLHDLWIHQEVLGWGYLGNICDLLSKDGGESAVSRGLQIYCFYQQGELNHALQSMDKVRARYVNDVNLLGLHAFLLFKSGRTNEAKALLQLPRAGESELAQLVKARLCQSQREWSCAEAEWQKVRLRDSRNVAALAGLARVAIAQGKKELAQDYLKQGLLISSNYAPFLQLKDELNEE